MRLVVVGAGKVGTTLVEKLSGEKHDVIIVDIDAKTVEGLVNKLDIRGIVGGGADKSVLEEAEADKADFFIACTSRDELNVLSCMLAKKMGAKYVVARVRDPEYYSEEDYMSKEFGIDMLFNPELRTAEEIAEILKFPSAVNIESFADGSVVMIELLIKKGNPIIDKSVFEIVKTYNVKLLFSMVERDGKVFIPRGDFVIREGDRVHITAPEGEIATFSKGLQIYKRRAKSVFIVGGGKISYYLARNLIESRVKVTIIDINKDRCKELSEKLPEATILCGDGTDQEVLDEEGMKKCDACVALTGMDEENVIISLYAASCNVSKVISKVDRFTVAQMVRNLGLDTVVSPRNVIANKILRFVRAYRPGNESSINRLYKIGDKVEALEFSVTDKCDFTGVPLKELHIKNNSLVNGIVRNKEYIVPTGDSRLETGDDVLIVTTDKNVTDLNQIIK